MNYRIRNTEDKKLSIHILFQKEIPTLPIARLRTPQPLTPPLRHSHSTAEPPQISRTRNAIKQFK